MTTGTSARLAEDAGWELDEEPDVLVVGARPVGLFAALLLARQGFGVAIVDEERRPAARSHALALHPLSLHLLAEAGAGPALFDRGDAAHLAGPIGAQSMEPGEPEDRE